jgi:hypothetical protein
MEGRGKLTTILNVIEYPKAIERDVDVIFPEKKDYYKAIEVMTSLLKKGKPLPVVDVLLASMCMNHDFTFRTRDRHFEKISQEFSEFKLVMED